MKHILEVRCEMVSVVVLRGQGTQTQVLLLKRAGQVLAGVWSYVAGHIEAGETGWHAARRELQEETGLLPLAFYATTFCERYYEPADDCVQLVPAFVARIAHTTAVRLNGEHSAFRWLSFAAATEAVPFGSQRELFEHVKREFVDRIPADFLRIPS
ncbi:MAG TPA: NUDIX domain-containing protein [Nevskiaceae bacterium]|nr:NUDIX domain-containing protein [Nevskiaceae bacterium]